jgi:hypothetical protein
VFPARIVAWLKRVRAEAPVWEPAEIHIAAPIDVVSSEAGTELRKALPQIQARTKAAAS